MRSEFWVEDENGSEKFQKEQWQNAFVERFRLLAENVQKHFTFFVNVPSKMLRKRCPACSFSF